MRWSWLPILVVLTLAADACWGAVWAEVRSSPAGNTVDVKHRGYQIWLIWNDTTIPGSELVLTSEHEERYGTTTILRYRFTGIQGDSARISVKGGMQRPGETGAESDGSFDQVLHIERAADGAFYFIPPAIQGIGKFRISPNPQSLGSYDVALQKDG